MTTDLVLIAFAAGLAVCAGVMLLMSGFSNRPPSVRERSAKPFTLPNPGRGVTAVVVGFLVVALTQWFIAGVMCGVLVYSWGRVFRSTIATADRVRLEAIAKWLEDLRDVVRGSNLSMEAALEQTASTPPKAIASELARFVALRRRAVPVDEALISLADDLAHPTADAAIAAMLLAVGTSGASLWRTLSDLAVVARDEVGARTRSDRIRTAYEQTMRRLVGLSIVIVGFLRFFAKGLVQPLATPTGQLWLIVPVTVWAGAIFWLRSLAGYQLPRRYRLRAVEQ
jgi:hypothetical protein